MDLQLTDRVALVTGASSGIGAGTAKILAEEGCKVAITARRREQLEQVADEIAAAGRPRPTVIGQDIMANDAAANLKKGVDDAFGTSIFWSTMPAPRYPHRWAPTSRSGSIP